MAITPIGADSAPVTLPGAMPPAPAVMAILNRFNRDELGNTIEVLVALLDIWEGDPDNEPNGDDEAREADGDTKDASYVEWHTMRGSQKHGANIASDNEDDEDDDPAEEDDPSGQCDEDEVNTAFDAVQYTVGASGPGCPIADPDYGYDGS